MIRFQFQLFAHSFIERFLWYPGCMHGIGPDGRYSNHLRASIVVIRMRVVARTEALRQHMCCATLGRWEQRKYDMELQKIAFYALNVSVVFFKFCRHLQLSWDFVGVYDFERYTNVLSMKLRFWNWYAQIFRAYSPPQHRRTFDCILLGLIQLKLMVGGPNFTTSETLRLSCEEYF